MQSHLNRRSLILITAGFMLGGVSGPLRAQTVPATSPIAPDDIVQSLSWPRSHDVDGTKILIYQPQLDTWVGDVLSARAAVALTPPGATAPRYGTIWLSARTEIDKSARMVTLEDVKVTKASFPKYADLADTYQSIIANQLKDVVRDVPLDQLEASVVASIDASKAQAQPVKNDPPAILFTTRPAMLVIIDGEPVLREVPDTGLMRVVNTRACILLESKSGKYYCHAMGGWYESAKPAGPWGPASQPPRELDGVLDSLAKQQVADRLDPREPGAAPKVPVELYVAVQPSELIQTQGEPEFVAIDGTSLLYARNTDAAIFKHLGQPSEVFILISGRWFAGPSLAGPWRYVPGASLPEDFKKIPEDHPKANVLVSVPGTPAAEESVIANSIPQTATVRIADAKLDVRYDGKPKFKNIDGAEGLSFAENCALPVLFIKSEKTYWCVNNGIWFTAKEATGPWVVATVVPGVIYTIPVSSPLHYVTYVRIYGTTADTVVCGYSPGYMGTCVSTDGVVVYGTGYYYPAYVGTVWVGYPPTYGYGAGFACGAATGFAFGLAAGAILGDAWCHPYWGPCGWGGGWGYAHVDLNSANVYRSWGGGVTAVNRHYEYNGWTGEERSQGLARTFNPYTGRAGVGGYSNYYNHDTHDYNLKRAGATYDPRTGVIKGGALEIDGDTDSGNRDIDAAKGRYNTRTNTGFARTDDSVYAGHDGNVYRYNRDDGTIDKRDGDDWNRVSDLPRGTENRQDNIRGATANESARDRTGSGYDRERQSIQRESRSRHLGQQRFEGHQRSFGGGGGGFRRR